MGCEHLNIADRVVLRVTEHLIDFDFVLAYQFYIDTHDGTSLSLMVVIFLVRAIADLINLLLNTRRKDLNFHTYIELSSFNLARDASSYAFYHINILQTHAQRLVDWTLRCAKFLQSHKQ